MGKARQIKIDSKSYGFRPLPESETSHSRLDLNSLLNRAQEEKRKSKKLNLLIFSGSVTVVLVFFGLLSI